MSRNRSHWDPDWVCPLCYVTVHGRKSSCIKCKTPKLKKGDWVCSCRTFNFSDKTACVKCQLPKPAFCVCEAPGVQQFYRSVSSPYPHTPCINCRGEEIKGHWTCRCSKQIPSSEPRCDKCEATRPEWCTCRTPSFKYIEYVEGRNCLRCCLPDRNRDWTCQCGHLNFDFKSTCAKCQTEKPRICGCDNPKFKQRTTLEGKVVDCGPCLNCRKSPALVAESPSIQNPVKKRGQVKDLEDRVAQLEQKAIESEKRFTELEARLSQLELK